MPRSKSKRSTYVPPKPSKPPPSPRWVPITGTALIVGGLLLILLNYVFSPFPVIGNYSLVLGFAVMAAGLIVLSRWR